jgi:CheY-like chemotaxis protein
MNAKKILLVEDDGIILRSLQTLLNKAGYQTTAVSDGLMAIDAATDDQFDLIVCDIRMPGLTGIETLQKIRDIYKMMNKEHPPEIFLTGYAEEHCLEQANSMKVAAIIYKPFDAEILLSHIRKCFHG